MKTYSTAQKKALDRPRLKPIYLVEIALQNAGPTLYLSDRNILIGSQTYENYLHSLDGLAEELRRDTSEGLNADITLKFHNARFQTYNYLIEIGDTYPWEGATTTVKAVYLDDANNPSDALTIFKGALDEPQNIDLLGFEASVSSMPVYRDTLFKQPLITKADYANADPGDLNKPMNIIYGSCPRVRCHAIKAGAVDNLTADITSSATSIVLSDASEFPSSGAFTIQIDDEQIRISSRSTNTLTVQTRGYNSTTATAHDKGREVFEVLTEYIYLVAGHAVKALNDIYVDGVRQTAGFTKYTGQTGSEHASYPGLAVIAFTAKPVIKKQVNLSNDLSGYTVTDNIAVTVAGSTKTIYPSGHSGSGLTNPGNAYDGNDDSYASVASGNGMTLQFPSTNYGTIATQYVWAKLGTGSWTISNWTPSSISGLPSTGAYVRFSKSGGSWGDTITFDTSGGSTIYEVRKEVAYTPTATKTGNAYDSGSIGHTGVTSADVVVGSQVNVDVDGYQDRSSLYYYTGTANALIERPDHVLKHFLDIYGESQFYPSYADFDLSSFSAAGSSYASAISGGYKFAFVIDQEITPSEFVAKLAWQCRSALKYEAGKWYLNYLPDTAPTAVKTITKGELAGKYAKFTFGKTSGRDILNDLTAKFSRNYGRFEYDESEWSGTSTATDSTSQGKYGVKPETYEFPAIRLQAMADHVLAFILLQRKNPLLIVEFPAWWEHFDLERGDTFDIDNPLYDAKKFFIEKIERIDQFRAKITGLEWP